MGSVNAGAEYFAAEAEYQHAKTPEEKLKALQKMLMMAPDHKSSEKIRQSIKQRISKARKEIISEKVRKAAQRKDWSIKKEGCGQVIVLGFANSGKTYLVNELTGSKYSSTTVPFETKKPQPGMMDVGGAQVQLVDMPSIKNEIDGFVMGMVRTADAVVLMVDPTWDEKFQRSVLDTAENNTKLYVKKGKVDGVKEKIFAMIEVIRVFTKEAGKDAEYSKPLTLAKGNTVLNAALKLHKDFYKNFKYARVWGSAKFPGQRVSGGFILADGDVVEIHIK